MSRSVLVIAAHGDDEVLGAGGTLAAHAMRGDVVHRLLFCSSDTSSRGAAASGSRAEAVEASGVDLGIRTTCLLDYPDNALDTIPRLTLTKHVESAFSEYRPSIVYTHSPFDLNQDHQIVSSCVSVAARTTEYVARELYHFEVRSSSDWAEAVSTGRRFRPNTWVALDDISTQRKMAALRSYDDEMRDWPHSRSYEAVNVLLHHRGSQVGCAAAEAFELVFQTFQGSEGARQDQVTEKNGVVG